MAKVPQETGDVGHRSLAIRPLLLGSVTPRSWTARSTRKQMSNYRSSPLCQTLCWLFDLHFLHGKCIRQVLPSPF